MIAILGASGQVGSALVGLLGAEALPVTRTDLDLEELDSIAPWIRRHRPDVLINCAAYTAVDAAETDPDRARRVNADAVAELAVACGDMGIRFVTFSTDYVFDGTKGSPYVESDDPHPLNVYGATKLDGEVRAIDANPRTLVIRTSWVMSGTHPNFLRTILRLLREGPVRVVADQVGRPTFAEDLAPKVIELARTDTAGVVHLTNRGETSWWGLAREAAGIAGHDPELVEPITTAESGRPAPRPADSRLDTERLGPAEALPYYRDTLEQVVRQIVASTPNL